MKDFFNNFNFDRIDSFRLNRHNKITCIQKFNKFEVFDENGNQLPNGILDDNSKINPTAELVTSTSNIEIIGKLKNLFKEERTDLLNYEIPLFKSALLFYNNETLIKGINISFNQGVFQSTLNENLKISENEFELFRLFFYQDLRHELYEGASYFGLIGQNWQRHIFPNSLYYNPHWKSYEASIHTSIICQNYDSVKLEIETNGNKISPIQIDKVFYVMNYPFELRDRMNNMILEYYNEMINDYSLPRLSSEQIDNLKYFVKLVAVTIYDKDDSDILLSFENWDEEHGLHMYINELNQKMEFAF